MRKKRHSCSQRTNAVGGYVHKSTAKQQIKAESDQCPPSQIHPKSMLITQIACRRCPPKMQGIRAAGGNAKTFYEFPELHKKKKRLFGC
jgi:hypothetical protein